MTLVLALEFVLATVVSLALVQFILRPASRLLFLQKEQAELDFARTVATVCVRYLEQAQRWNRELRDGGNRKARAMFGVKQWLAQHNVSVTTNEIEAVIEEAVNEMQELKIEPIIEEAKPWVFPPDESFVDVGGV